MCLIFICIHLITFVFLCPSRRFSGVRIGLFTPDKAFDLVCKTQIARIREPAVKLVDLVTHELISSIKDGLGKVKRSGSSSHPRRLL